jgi:hypothetical protein
MSSKADEMARTYFEVLNIMPGAAPDEIRSAYRDEMLIWHPDRFPANERVRARAQNQARLINEAFEYLRIHATRYRDATFPGSTATQAELERSLDKARKSLDESLNRLRNLEIDLIQLRKDNQAQTRCSDLLSQKVMAINQELAEAVRWRNYWQAEAASSHRLAKVGSNIGVGGFFTASGLVLLLATVPRWGPLAIYVICGGCTLCAYGCLKLLTTLPLRLGPVPRGPWLRIRIPNWKFLYWRVQSDS